MRPTVVGLLSTVQLGRLANGFAGVANVWFVILWTRANSLEHDHQILNDAPLWLLLGLGAVIGVGLAVHAGAINDVFDQRRDRALAPRRPIPSGRISPQSATVVGVASLLAAILAATARGSDTVLMVLLCAAAILFFNRVARHLPGLSMPVVGLIYASHMLAFNLGLRFVWPVALVVVHAVGVHVAVRILERKRPRFTLLSLVGGVLGVLGLLAALVMQAEGHGVLVTEAFDWYGLGWPLAMVVLFVLSSINKVRFASSAALAAEKLHRYGALWMGLYGVGWLLGAGLWAESAVLGALVVTAVLWMLFVRDLGAWIERPLGYQW